MNSASQIIPAARYTTRKIRIAESADNRRTDRPIGSLSWCFARACRAKLLRFDHQLQTCYRQPSQDRSDVPLSLSQRGFRFFWPLLPLRLAVAGAVIGAD